MKLFAKVAIFALVFCLALGDPTTSTSNTTNSTVVPVCTTTTQYWNGTNCTSCPTGCATCNLVNNSVSCITCLNTSSFLQVNNTNGVNVASCVSCIGNCSTCRGPQASDCITPATGYTYNPINQIIYACSQANCQFCNADGTCGTCNIQYNVSNGLCSACSAQGCASCPTSSSSCSVCLSGYYLNGITCVACSGNSSICNGTIALKCASGYFLNGTCVACPSSCASCDIYGNCTSCQAGYFLNTSNATNITCNACSAQCTNCTNATSCAACTSTLNTNGFSYYLNSSSLCNSCSIANCKACNNTGSCATCYANYFANTTDGNCYSCGTGCASCNATACTQCQAGYLLTTYNGTVQNCTALSACGIGNQTDDYGNCSYGNISNCLYGNANTSTCLVCANGYFANGSICAPCPIGCITCGLNSSGYLSCSSIYTGAGFTDFANSTNKVDSTGYLCPKGCATCNQAGNCTSCMPSFELTQSLNNTVSGSQFCLPINQCPIPVAGTSSNISCYSNLLTQNTQTTLGSSSSGTATKTSVKLAMSFIAAIVAALYVF